MLGEVSVSVFESCARLWDVSVLCPTRAARSTRSARAIPIRTTCCVSEDRWMWGDELTGDGGVQGDGDLVVG